MEKREREELLARALGGELDPGQRTRFEALLAADDGFRTEWEQLRRAGDLVSEARAEGFGPHFSARVLARLRSERAGAPGLADGLMRLFRPLVPVTLAVALFLAVLNWRDRGLAAEGASFLEITFAVPPVSAETAELLEM